MYKYYLIFYFFIIIFCSLSCADCEDAVNYHRKSEFNLILQEEPSSGRAYTLRGINPTTKDKETYNESGGFLSVPFLDLITIGDTLVKKQGELKVYIHKKDTIIIYKFRCDGKIYE